MNFKSQNIENPDKITDPANCIFQKAATNYVPMLRRVKSEEAEEDSKLHILQDAEDDDSEDDSSDVSVEDENEDSNTNENQDSSIDTEHLFGPRKTIPENVLHLLEEWHMKHPSIQPECSYRNRLPKTPSKVFNRSGKELFLSLFLIKQPIRYTIMLMHDVHGPGKLVASISHDPSRSYLLGWNGVEKGYEMEVSAVRLFARHLGEIGFSPQDFDKAPAQPRPFRTAAAAGSPYAIPASSDAKAMPTTSTATSTTAPNNTTPSNRRRTRPRASGSSYVFRAAHPETESESESESEASDPSSESDNNSSSSSSSSSSKKHPTRPAKRLKTTNHVSPPQPQPQPAQHPAKPHQIAFKLISELSDATRCFPISECTTGKDLFSKAKKFYQMVDDESEATVLSCRIPSRHERRYLFQGSEGEFNMLLHDVNSGLQGGSRGEETSIVEVRCMD